MSRQHDKGFFDDDLAVKHLVMRLIAICVIQSLSYGDLMNLFTNSNEIEKLNIYPCEMDMLRDRRNNIS